MTLQVAARQGRQAGQQDVAVAEVDAATIAGYQEDDDAIGWKQCDATTLVSCRCANHIHRWPHSTCKKGELRPPACIQEDS